MKSAPGFKVFLGPTLLCLSMMIACSPDKLARKASPTETHVTENGLHVDQTRLANHAIEGNVLYEQQETTWDGKKTTYIQAAFVQPQANNILFEHLPPYLFEQNILSEEASQ